jgi:hypothetical protein
MMAFLFVGRLAEHHGSRVTGCCRAKKSPKMLPDIFLLQKLMQDFFREKGSPIFGTDFVIFEK